MIVSCTSSPTNSDFKLSDRPTVAFCVTWVMIPLLVVLCHILRLVLCYISVDSFQSGGCPFADWIFGRGFSNSVCWSISGFGSSDMHQLGATIYASQDHPDGNPQHSNGSFDLFVALEGAMCIFRWCRSNSVAAVCWIGRPGWAHALCLLVDQNIQKLASPLRPTHTHTAVQTHQTIFVDWLLRFCLNNLLTITIFVPIVFVMPTMISMMTIPVAVY